VVWLCGCVVVWLVVWLCGCVIVVVVALFVWMCAYVRSFYVRICKCFCVRVCSCVRVYVFLLSRVCGGAVRCVVCWCVVCGCAWCAVSWCGVVWCGVLVRSCLRPSRIWRRMPVTAPAIC
jgi:hypothetical protein